MKIVVLGGSGLIGSKVIAHLTSHGHEAVAASLQSGVNVLTGEGLKEALAGADVVLDVTNSPSFADDDVMDFFRTSTENQIAAEREAGVGHHVALSIVGADLLPDSGYLRAKVAQENLIKSSGVPYTIVRSTQFFEFGKAIADSATQDGVARLSSGAVQPIASDDVARMVAKATAGAPVNGVIEIGGPEKFSMAEFASKALAREGDTREVIADPAAPYFGTLIHEELVPGPDGQLGETRYDDWGK
ncbi:SDR family oxidoreductase [Kibdelosporangium philippinense]|uniref:SDR family oxidoreductase n=1 Tax=Kibdelosporangium philippinense TaxID=211113 RepID=A0ABS8ZBN2_9PSEU|nr:SDR family oxidoreductase [Kibdelosporangium philippinense]MCE7004438.1 SDR family oxidoreductase [Kibdelosporangium philippinense]